MDHINKKIWLIFHGRFPSEKAASLFAAKIAESFSEKGLDVTLLVPKRFGSANKDFADYYKIEENFNVVYLPTIDLFSIRFFGKFNFYLSFFIFSISTLIYLLFRANKIDVIYSNESLPLLASSFRFKNIFYEVHDYPENKKYFYKLFLRRCRWILSTNEWKKNKLIKDFSLNSKKILVEPNAVEISKFNIEISKEEARNKLNLPKDKKIILYTGHLYSWKGTDLLAKAGNELPDNFVVIFVGGTDLDIFKYKEKYGQQKLKFAGFRPHEEIPLWQKAADILILPNTGKEKISLYYTSPMKLFEYMASKRPVIASKLPSIEFILGKEYPFYFDSDDKESLISMINFVFNFDNSEEVINSSFKKVFNHTWQNRATRIMSFIYG